MGIYPRRLAVNVCPCTPHVYRNSRANDRNLIGYVGRINESDWIRRANKRNLIGYVERMIEI